MIFGEMLSHVETRIYEHCISDFLRVFENRVLRRVFGPKRDEVTGE
jgi:hypothetical protein